MKKKYLFLVLVSLMTVFFSCTSNKNEKEDSYEKNIFYYLISAIDESNRFQMQEKLIRGRDTGTPTFAQSGSAIDKEAMLDSLSKVILAEADFLEDRVFKVEIDSTLNISPQKHFTIYNYVLDENNYLWMRLGTTFEMKEYIDDKGLKECHELEAYAMSGNTPIEEVLVMTNLPNEIDEIEMIQNKSYQKGYHRSNYNMLILIPFFNIDYINRLKEMNRILVVSPNNNLRQQIEQYKNKTKMK